MNHRQKKKQVKKYNKKLIERYPFLLPRNAFTDEPVWEYDYTWTEYDCIAGGWRKAFGKLLLEELREACIKTNYLDKLRFLEIKEKFGTLRMYTNGAPQEVHDVIQDYEFVSQCVCIQCGSPHGQIVNDYGWYLPMCKNCWDKNNKRRKTKGYKTIPWEEVSDEEYKGIPNEYKMTIYGKGNKYVETYDISRIVDYIKKGR